MRAYAARSARLSHVVLAIANKRRNGQSRASSCCYTRRKSGESESTRDRMQNGANVSDEVI